MTTEGFTPEARRALVRCCRLLLQLVDDEERRTATAGGLVPHSQPLDNTQDGDSDSKEVAITNETA